MSFSNPQNNSVDLTVSPNVLETTGLEYAIYESSQNKYVQANGTLGVSPVWQRIGTGAGEWGQGAGVSGKITVNGLTNNSFTYSFAVKSRNTSDSSHLATSESALSGSGGYIFGKELLATNTILHQLFLDAVKSHFEKS